MELQNWVFIIFEIRFQFSKRKFPSRIVTLSLNMIRDWSQRWWKYLEAMILNVQSEMRFSSYDVFLKDISVGCEIEFNYGSIMIYMTFRISGLGN